MRSCAADPRTLFKLNPEPTGTNLMEQSINDEDEQCSPTPPTILSSLSRFRAFVRSNNPVDHLHRSPFRNHGPLGRLRFEAKKGMQTHLPPPRRMDFFVGWRTLPAGWRTLPQTARWASHLCSSAAASDCLRVSEQSPGVGSALGVLQADSAPACLGSLQVSPSRS